MAPQRRVIAQALVEFALVIPLIVCIFAILLQFGILFMVYLNILHVTRDAGRWLAVHPDSTDAAVEQYIRSDLSSGLDPAGLTFNFSSANSADWPWTPNCPVLVSLRCPNRVSGEQQRIGLIYDTSRHVILPSQLGAGWWQFTIPWSIPRYNYYVLIEQR